MRFVLGHLPVMALLLVHTNAADTGTGIQCPIVGPVPPAQCDGSDNQWVPVSVEGSHTFCTLGPEVCVAEQFAACPGPSAALPFGAKCVQLNADVYGCVPKSSCTDGELDVSTSASDSASPCDRGCVIDPTIPKRCNGTNGWTPVSVVNSSTFCTAGTSVCVAQSQSVCPGPQRGLPFGSSCVRIPSGVFGCVPNKQCQTTCATRATATTSAPSFTPAPTAVITVTPSATSMTMPPAMTTAVPATTTAVPATATSVPVPTTSAPLPATLAPLPSTTPPTAAPTDITPGGMIDDPSATVAPGEMDGNVDLLPIPDPAAPFILSTEELSATIPTLGE